jgi:hypothetical protein
MRPQHPQTSESDVCATRVGLEYARRQKAVKWEFGSQSKQPFGGNDG